MERLAQVDKVDEFLEALDADDFVRAKALTKQAGVDAEVIAIVLKKMNDADGKH